MTHGSLFSGIGGFDLAAEWMGWENVFHCEWNKFGQQVLKYYWPNSISYDDITKTDFTIHRGKIDIITGGFPCQPYSSAGKRLGKEDERHLWPQMLRTIREVQPRWVVGENVLGLVNWSGGLVFHEVQADLEAEGYEVQPFVLPAVSVNAPHRRDRVWFVAFYSKSKRDTKIGGFFKRKDNESIGVCQENWDVANTECTRLEHRNETRNLSNEKGKTSTERSQFANEFETDGDGERLSTNSNGIGLRRESNWSGESRFIGKNDKRNDWQNFPTVSPICSRDDGLSDRLDSITFPKWRNESIKAGGNAIVPQVVYQIFKTIEQYERITNTRRDPRSPNK